MRHFPTTKSTHERVADRQSDLLDALYWASQAVRINLMLLAGAVALYVLRAGRWSIDSLWGRQTRRRYQNETYSAIASIRWISSAESASCSASRSSIICCWLVVPVNGS